ncbi:DUF3450 domain-containing protein [Thalassomonas haliotis]|uniref:DUF3450 domain-containing protein n=1 Tax=Thalassomonas haliotis TaxID=485448 RepID=A0ABY7VHG3_9GAMM|nr:DUF3450 domain-containing protein [Thalassomonas haliotis]WDE12958.1 DUF3450 domain-containing protein [Thalassomonas haliotis]
MNLSKLAKACVCTTLATLALSTQAQPENNQLDNVVAQGQQINQSANKSQQRVDALNDKTQSKLQQFKTVNKEIDGLQVYNRQMQSQLDNQLAELAQIKESMTQVSIIERQVSPLMSRMITTLESFIELDVPFLPRERAQRLAGLKKMMERADIAVAEKFRRVLEAYQVEVDYGRTIETYSGLLEVAGSERDVDFLRIGRVSFVYQTRDGNHLGLWDRQSKSWQELPAKYRTDINKALRIARKQLAPDLIMVPLDLAE